MRPVANRVGRERSPRFESSAFRHRRTADAPRAQSVARPPLEGVLRLDGAFPVHPWPLTFSAANAPWDYPAGRFHVPMMVHRTCGNVRGLTRAHQGSEGIAFVKPQENGLLTWGDTPPYVTHNPWVGGSNPSGPTMMTCENVQLSGVFVVYGVRHRATNGAGHGIAEHPRVGHVRGRVGREVVRVVDLEVGVAE